VRPDHIASPADFAQKMYMDNLQMIFEREKALQVRVTVFFINLAQKEVVANSDETFPKIHPGYDFKLEIKRRPMTTWVPVTEELQFNELYLNADSPEKKITIERETKLKYISSHELIGCYQKLWEQIRPKWDQYLK
jgi:hypothetical protein